MEKKPKNMFGSIAPLEHKYYCSIWEVAKSGKLADLQGRSKILGQLMLEHPQYQYFWEIPYPFAQTELEAFKEGGADPDFHLTCEAIILEQIESRDPPEVYEAFEALVRVGKGTHDARHVIGRVFPEMVMEGSQMAERGQQLDEDFYLHRIRYLARHPKKVIRDQERKWEEGL